MTSARITTRTKGPHLMTTPRKPDVIDLVETVDPVTGQLVFAQPEAEGVVALRDGTLEPVAGTGSTQVHLPDETFAGEDPNVDWRAAEAQQDAGQVVSIVNGQLVTGQGSAGSGVTLPKDIFASPLLATETAEVRRIAGAGVAGLTIDLLRHTSSIPGYSEKAPVGWILTTKGNRFGDKLTVVISQHPSTNLYHAHFWRYEIRQDDGSRGLVNLPEYLGRHPQLTAHTAHIYPADGGGILCLSQRTTGGLPTLSDAILQCAKWADGMGDVVRGRPFKYRH